VRCKARINGGRSLPRRLYRRSSFVKVFVLVKHHAQKAVPVKPALNLFAVPEYGVCNAATLADKQVRSVSA